MKKIFSFLLILIVTTNAQSQVQSYNKAIGPRLIGGTVIGSGAAFNFKFFLKDPMFFAGISDKLAIETFASVSGINGIGYSRFCTSINGFIEPHKNIASTGLAWYWGVGASVGLISGSDSWVTSYTSPTIGPRGIFGIEYILPHHHWAFSTDLVNGFDYVPNWAVPFTFPFYSSVSAKYLLDYTPR